MARTARVWLFERGRTKKKKKTGNYNYFIIDSSIERENNRIHRKKKQTVTET